MKGDMMDFLELTQKRYSVRSFKEISISAEEIKKIMMAVNYAPSAKNLQQWRFYWVKNRELKQKLMKAAKNQKFVGEASHVLVGVGTKPEYDMTCGHPAYVIDLSIALEHAALAAAELGIGTCWIGAYYRDEVKKVMGLPENEEPVQMMVFGYPEKEITPSKNRKDVSEIYEIID